MQAKTKLEIRRLTTELVADLKKNRWITSGCIKLPNCRTLLAYQKSDGTIGMDLFGNSKTERIRQKRIEDRAQKLTWAWRVGHNMVHRPDLVQKLRDRQAGPAKTRTKPTTSYEVRNG